MACSCRSSDSTSSPYPLLASHSVVPQASISSRRTRALRNELLFAGRARRDDGLNDAAAVGRDGGIRLAAQTPLQLRAPIARVDDVSVRIDEARHHRAAARIDPRGAFLHGDGIGERARRADVRDASFESRDDATREGETCRAVRGHDAAQVLRRWRSGQRVL